MNVYLCKDFIYISWIKDVFEVLHDTLMLFRQSIKIKEHWTIVY